MTRVKLVSNSFLIFLVFLVNLFLNFYERVFNEFENIPPQNKDTELVSVRKVCMIKPFLSTFN